MSIALDPVVIVADEATSALDVVVQRVVAQTMLKIKRELNVSFIMIGHDMGLMAQVVDRLAVMYSGQLLEIASVKDMFASPAHPYSEILIESVPHAHRTQAYADQRRYYPRSAQPTVRVYFQVALPVRDGQVRGVPPRHGGSAPGISWWRVTCGRRRRTARMSDSLFEIRNVSKIYGPEDTGLVALSDYSFTIPKEPARIITIAGESGSGKSTLGELLLRSSPPTRGQILFEGVDIWKFNEQQKRDYHRHVQAVFQDPFGVYNPFYRIEHVFDMVLKNYKLAASKQQGRELAEEALNAVGLRGDDVLRKYPHQLSGGQRQRIMIARATMLKPRFIVADEPVSMVDASLRASILDVMMNLRDEYGISFLYVTHDLSTAYQIGDQILLLYQGTVAEHGNAMDVISNPQHPYVQLLIESVPKPDPDDPWPGEVELPAEESFRTAAGDGLSFLPALPETHGAMRIRDT